jgi:hypothetical protein
MSACDFGSDSIRRTCRSKVAGVERRPLLRKIEQLLVRWRTPQEEGQPRGECRIAKAICTARAHVRRFALDAEDELRTGQETPQREVDPGVEAAAIGAPCLKNASSACEVFTRHVAAIGAARQGQQGSSARRPLLPQRLRDGT